MGGNGARKPVSRPLPCPGVAELRQRHNFFKQFGNKVEYLQFNLHKYYI